MECTTLVSHVLRQACRAGVCQPVAGQQAPQEQLVQTFATAEECLRVREQMLHQIDQATELVNTVVQARSPQWYLRTTMTVDG